MKRLLAIVLLGIMITFSGCVGEETKIDENNGILISSFSIDPVEGEDIDDYLFTVDLENVGGTTADTVDVTFYGADGWIGTSSHGTYTLDPPNPLINTRGDFKIISTPFIPPDIPQGVGATFPITARVTFEYSATGTITVPAYSKTLYKIKENQGEPFDTAAIVDNTYSPIQIELSRSSAPVIVNDQRTGSDDATFLIDFVNVGSGWPLSKGTAGRVGGLTGTIEVSGNGVTFDDCLGYSGGNSITITENNLNIPTMRANGRVPVSCSINIDRSQWSETSSGIIFFRISMNYEYYVEEQINVKVYGTEEAPSTAPPPTPGTTQPGGGSGGLGTVPSSLCQLGQPGWICYNGRPVYVDSACGILQQLNCPAGTVCQEGGYCNQPGVTVPTTAPGGGTGTLPDLMVDVNSVRAVGNNIQYTIVNLNDVKVGSSFNSRLDTGGIVREVQSFDFAPASSENGGQLTRTFAYHWVCPLGQSQSIQVCVDRAQVGTGVIDETDETNNCVVKLLPCVGGTTTTTTTTTIPTTVSTSSTSTTATTTPPCSHTCLDIPLCSSAGGSCVAGGCSYGCCCQLTA